MKNSTEAASQWTLGPLCLQIFFSPLHKCAFRANSRQCFCSILSYKQPLPSLNPSGCPQNGFPIICAWRIALFSHFTLCPSQLYKYIYIFIPFPLDQPLQVRSEWPHFLSSWSPQQQMSNPPSSPQRLVLLNSPPFLSQPAHIFHPNIPDHPQICLLRNSVQKYKEWDVFCLKYIWAAV